MNRLAGRLPSLNLVLWMIAGVVIGAAILVYAPDLFGASPSAPVQTAAALETWTPTPAPTPTGTALPDLPSPMPQVLDATPTLAANAQPFVFSADSTRSGFAVLSQAQPNWGDPNLHVGFVQGQSFESVLYFDITALPLDTKILFADVELVGLSRDFVGSNGSWRLDLLQPAILKNWTDHSPQELAAAASAATIGDSLKPQNLLADHVNQFVFSPDQRALLESVVNTTGIVAFRLTGPSGPADNLFTWDGGAGGDTSRLPVLRVVANPGTFVIVPNVPTPENVMTAAAVKQTATAYVARYGTPTPYPRNYATATPIIVVTSQPTPANEETAVADSAYATAVAETTGTFTPTPSNWITATPTPETPTVVSFPTWTPTAVALENLTPVLTPTPQPSLAQLLQTPVPSIWKGAILFLSTRFGPGSLIAMNASGQLLPTQPTGMDPYTLAFARESLSPDHTRRVVVAPDSNGALQIWISDLNNVILSQLTHLARSGGFMPKAYDPVWSPDGTRIAFVSTATRSTEIYVYDLASQTTRQITFTGNDFIFNQRPSWSPDGSQIVFKSNRQGGHFQIWIMNADGSNPQNLSQSDYDDTDPVWVK